jgi:hypothetical protein
MLECIAAHFIILMYYYTDKPLFHIRDERKVPRGWMKECH